MQIEVYRMDAEADSLTIALEAVCDSFSSLLWDIEYYQCGSFEAYIAANPENISIFQAGRIVGRDDDNQHFGIIESVQIDTDAENGDYLTVKGRFLMCLLERRIINPTLSITADTAYSDIVRNAVVLNAIQQDNRRIPGLSLGNVSGSCWEQTATLQVSYENLMEWLYTICEKIGGTANIRLVKDVGETYKMVLDLAEGTDRSLLQEENPHIIFSDAYSNLLSFSYASDTAITRNFAYIYGHGEGAERKKAVTAAVGRIGGRPHFLYGKLFCGECGEPMTRRTLNGPKGIKHKVWTCRGRHEGRKGNGCKCRNVKENELIDTISERIGEELTEENASMLKKVFIEMDDISIEYADNVV